MIKLAIFDMDGTVFESHLDWSKIKEEMGIKDDNILKEIYKDNSVDHVMLEILEHYEEINTEKTEPIRGISRYLHFLGTRNIKTALLTNNNKKNADFLLRKFNLNFDTMITREMKLWKPDPDAIFYLMDLYNCRSDEIISIGDSHYDIKASKAANISNIFIIQKTGTILHEDKNIYYFDDYFHLKEIFKL